MDFCNIYSPARREERALVLLRRVGLEQVAYTLPGAVAGGQQQCAAVARSLANDPPILIADEPTGNLDSHTAERVMEIFEELADQGKTIIIVTHDRYLAQRTKRRLLITDGELVNEMLAAIFPDGSHTQLLLLSKQAETVHLPPGAPVRAADDAPATVLIVVRGEIISERAGEKTCSTSGSLIDPRSIRSALCSGDQGAELLALPLEGVLPLLSTIDPLTPVFPAQPESNPPSRIESARTRRTK
jgi:energy-coupling factor transporter ATP-binding protein EcfA2